MRLRAVLAACLLALLGQAWARPELAIVPAQGSVEIAFTPGDDAEGAILRAVHEARHSVQVQAFLFTSRTLANALIAAKRRGVAVELLTDREMLIKGQNSQVPQLASAGIPVWLEVRYAAAHNKVMLIDAEEAGCAVITGSYNFTHSAQSRNAENLLILRGNPALARAYLDNWRRHRDEAVRYSGAVE